MTLKAVRNALVRKWSARSRTPQWHNDLWLEFKIEGLSAELAVNHETATIPEWSEVHLAWPAPYSLRVAPEEFTTWIRRMLGGDDLKLGHADFDKAFWVESSNADWARELLGEDIRTRLLELRALGRGRNRICLDVSWAGIRTRVFRHFGKDEAALNTLVETSLAVFRRARGPVTKEPVEILLVQRRADGICPVCSSPAPTRLVCPGCQTPHHGECWRYSGGCGIFACSGRARRARR